MIEQPISMTGGGLNGSGFIGGGGGLGNRVNAIVLSTVLASQEAAMKQMLNSLGIGSQINALF